MDVWKFIPVLLFFNLCLGSYHEQYRVPTFVDNKWESYVFGNTEYVIQNSLVNWENAMILCRGYHNGTLAVMDTREKAEFMAEALSESQFDLTSVWVGARRESAEDPAGYRWGQGPELRRTALDVLSSEKDENSARHFPLWLNRTHVPVPEGGADCVAIERIHHDSPVFLDLPCQIERPFACQREARGISKVTEVKNIRCRGGMYHLFDGKLSWDESAAYCVIRGMNLANIGTLKCLRKLGMTMLKNRPNPMDQLDSEAFFDEEKSSQYLGIENAWVGAKGNLGKWNWIDTGTSLFQTPLSSDAHPAMWPPMRDRNNVKQNGCLQLDRHASHAPVFMEARCERKMQFICYEDFKLKSQELESLENGIYNIMSRRSDSNITGTITQASSTPPSDDLYYYVLVKQRFYWQHANKNCLKMNGTLAALENNDILVQLLLLMGENKEEPIEHIWISGRLNMSKDITTDSINYAWYNPINAKRIPDPKAYGDANAGLYMPPWLDEEFNMDNSCLNLDRQDHLIGLVYGLPCDTAQYSVCMIEKSSRPSQQSATESTAPDPGYESS